MVGGCLTQYSDHHTQVADSKLHRPVHIVTGSMQLSQGLICYTVTHYQHY